MSTIHTKAKKSYSIEDIIITFEPLVHVIFFDNKGLRCDYCTEFNTDLKKCSNCNQMFY